MEQVIIKGIDQLRPLLTGKKFFLVRDQSYDYLQIKNFFDTFPHVEFSGFTPNPLYEQICAGIEVYHKEDCDIIVAVGGGSTIDVAKCIKLYSGMECDTDYLRQEIKDTGIILIAVPTTAGTGSESTRHAVIYYEGVKQSISHSCIIPDYVVLEPSVLKSLPLYQKKCAMLDALCQAVESWWSVSSTDTSKEFSKKAVTAVRDNWKAYIEGDMEQAAGRIMEAANQSGKAINITATTAAHAMSYKITSLYGFPHGHAVAVCMTEVWKYLLEHTSDCVDNRGSEYLKNTLREIDEVVSYDWYCDLLKELDMRNPVSANKEADVELLTKSVNLVRLKNNPVPLTPEVVKQMYERIVK